MLHGFDGKVALVTGAAGGIGLATARPVRAEGARVVLVDLHADALAAARRRRCRPARRDGAGRGVRRLARGATSQRCVRQALERFGALDVVVNNAGLMSFKPLEQFTGDDWLRILGVDLLGAFFFTKQAFLHMKRAAARSSTWPACTRCAPRPQVAPYAAAKAALLSLTRRRAIEGREPRHPLQRRAAGRGRHADAARQPGGGRPASSTSTRTKCCSPRTSRPPSPSWPPTMPATSRARHWSSTAGGSASCECGEAGKSDSRTQRDAKVSQKDAKELPRKNFQRRLFFASLGEVFASFAHGGPGWPAPAFTPPTCAHCARCAARG